MQIISINRIMIFLYFFTSVLQGMNTDKRAIKPLNSLKLPDLQQAVLDCDLKTIKKILNANPLAVNNSNDPTSPPTLFFACSGYKDLLIERERNLILIEKKIKIVEILLEYDADVDIEFFYCGISTFPLYVATQERNIPAIMALLETGANINKQNDAGYTALHCAVLNNYKDIAILLLNYGADIYCDTYEVYSCDYWTSYNAYELAVNKKHIELTEILINWQNKYGKTLLHNAVCTDDILQVKKLLSLNALVNTHDNNNQTPLHQSVLKDNYEITELLIKHFPSCVDQDDQGNTPLHYACLNGNEKIALLLLTFNKYNNLNLVNKLNNDGNTAIELIPKNYYEQFKTIWNLN